MYRDKPYSPRPLEDVFEDIRQAANCWPDAHRVFLADGDALSLPTQTLLKILRELTAMLPQLTRVSCYATPANILRKTHEELMQVRQHGLKLLYLGIESGSNLILKKITKGATQNGIAKAMTKAHDSGLKVSGTVILGLGGSTHWQEHIDGTIELLNRASITYLSTLQLYLEHNVKMEFQAKYGEPFTMPDDIAILREQVRLVSGLNPPTPVIFRSNHASNALALAGNLPRDKEQLLAQLHAAINGQQPLRHYSLRGL
ncbi:Oxygen-independent coproporphyrinogen III oxidase, Fe-S oxidoreductase [hydrothermal vent metagenome]|uniref:Oxygen-independent coproporphyrinogen III oxidase, Fe-S oxidoreductase n=1 Tax=hydrothermal vent metagenome TaxID=652676 RepID=A0A3B1B833_9ZZZZ